MVREEVLNTYMDVRAGEIADVDERISLENITARVLGHPHARTTRPIEKQESDGSSQMKCFLGVGMKTSSCYKIN